jgi:hypothetical protein
MLDQCHNIEPKIPGQIRSVMNVQEATAKALLVDREALATAQREGDVLGANNVLMDAYNSDVRPLLGLLREQKGLDTDPYAAYRASGYQERIAGERVGGRQAAQQRQAHERLLEAPLDAGHARRPVIRGRHTVGAADRARCGSCRAAVPPDGRRRCAARAPFR